MKRIEINWLTIIFVHVHLTLLQKREELFSHQLFENFISNFRQLIFYFFTSFFADENNSQLLIFNLITRLLSLLVSVQVVFRLIEKPKVNWKAEVLRHSWQTHLIKERHHFRIPSLMHHIQVRENQTDVLWRDLNIGVTFEYSHYSGIHQNESVIIDRLFFLFLIFFIFNLWLQHWILFLQTIDFSLTFSHRLWFWLTVL